MATYNESNCLSRVQFYYILNVTCIPKICVYSVLEDNILLACTQPVDSVFYPLLFTLFRPLCPAFSFADAVTYDIILYYLSPLFLIFQKHVKYNLEISIFCLLLLVKH